MKEFWKEYWEENRSAVACILVFCLIVGCVFAVMAFAVKTLNENNYQRDIDPIWLEYNNSKKRQDWVKSCISSAGNGLLSGDSLRRDTVLACQDVGFKLFPEKDWELVAQLNRKP